MFKTIGFIGTGNMGGALAKAAAKGAPDARIVLSNRTPKKAELLAAELHCEVKDSSYVAENCGLIFLGVKPQMMGRLLKTLMPVFKKRSDRFVLASMAAGLSIDTVREMAGGEYPVIRLMPNTPVLVDAGVIQYCGLGTTEEELLDFEKLLSGSALVDRIGEELSDAASALSGCGPAFCALLIEALADGGVACGLPREKAQKYTAQVMKGAAMLVLETGIHPGVMKDGVCSPGGTTIQGIRTLEENGFRAAAINAVIAAYGKTVELGKNK